MHGGGDHNKPRSTAKRHGWDRGLWRRRGETLTEAVAAGIATRIGTWRSDLTALAYRPVPPEPPPVPLAPADEATLEAFG